MANGRDFETRQSTQQKIYVGKQPISQQYQALPKEHLNLAYLIIEKIDG